MQKKDGEGGIGVKWSRQRKLYLWGTEELVKVEELKKDSNQVGEGPDIRLGTEIGRCDSAGMPSWRF